MSDLAKYSMTRRVARSLCDSCASCFLVYANDLWYILLNLVLILVPFRAYFNDIYVTLKGKIVPVPHTCFFGHSQAIIATDDRMSSSYVVCMHVFCIWQSIASWPSALTLQLQVFTDTIESMNFRSDYNDHSQLDLQQGISTTQRLPK